MIQTLQGHVDDDNEKTAKRIDALEQSTLWQIKDYAELLRHRPTTEFLEEHVKASINQAKTICTRYTDDSLKKLRTDEDKL